MANIALVVDSTANPPREWLDRYPIYVVPLWVHWGEERYRDGVDITPEAFYTRLMQDKSVWPTTSQPSMQEFLKVFHQAADEGAEGILALLISSGISGTVQSAQMAAQEFTRIPVEIVDTRITSVGQALILKAAAKALEEGKSLQEAKAVAEATARQIRVFFVVDTLEYLHRGGRINTAARYLGTALQIKPILTFNEEGKIEAQEKVRTKKRALRRILELAEEHAQGRPVHVGIVHAHAREQAERLAEEARQRLDCRDLFIAEFSPVIGVHAGPGTVGLALHPAPS